MSTDKPTNNKNKYHELIMNRLVEKYGVTKRFITMSLNGDRVSETSASLKGDYALMVKRVTEFLKTM